MKFEFRVVGCVLLGGQMSEFIRIVVTDNLFDFHIFLGQGGVELVGTVAITTTKIQNCQWFFVFVIILDN